MIFIGLLFVRLSKKPWNDWRKLTLIIVTTILAICGFIATGVSIY